MSTPRIDVPHLGVAELEQWLTQVNQPTLDAPWPGDLDVPRWLWKQATPEFWQEEYPEAVDYTDYVAFPRITGMTGKSYTSVFPIDPDKPSKSIGWTMGVGGRFDVRIEKDVSFGYRLWRSLFSVLGTGRGLIDRAAARLDPLQAPREELDRLFEWAGGDDRLKRELPDATLRRYIQRARKIEKTRGTAKMLPEVDKVLGIQSHLEWSETPNLLKLTIYGKPTKIVRLFFRRNLPPHLLIELKAIESHITYTGWAMTSKASYAPGEVPQENEVTLTSTERVTTTVI